MQGCPSQDVPSPVPCIHPAKKKSHFFFSLASTVGSPHARMPFRAPCLAQKPTLLLRTCIIHDTPERVNIPRQHEIPPAFSVALPPHPQARPFAFPSFPSSSSVFSFLCRSLQVIHPPVGLVFSSPSPSECLLPSHCNTLFPPRPNRINETNYYWLFCRPSFTCTVAAVTCLDCHLSQKSQAPESHHLPGLGNRTRAEQPSSITTRTLGSICWLPSIVIFIFISHRFISLVKQSVNRLWAPASSFVGDQSVGCRKPLCFSPLLHTGILPRAIRFSFFRISSFGGRLSFWTQWLE